MRPLRPVGNGRALFLTAGGNIEIRCQPLVEPAREGEAKAADHRAHPYIGGERQHERHQRHGQAPKLLLRVRPKPCAKNRARLTAAQAKYQCQREGQHQGRPQKQTAEQGEARDQPVKRPCGDDAQPQQDKPECGLHPQGPL